jgi:N-acyl-L-homoserine lactone synthetase
MHTRLNQANQAASAPAPARREAGIAHYDFAPCTTEHEIRMTLRLRYITYCEERAWLDPSAYHDGEETDQFDSRSQHFFSHRNDQGIVGCSRLILGSATELPIERFVHLADLGVDRLRAAEVSRFCVVQNERENRLRVFLGLCRIMTAWALEGGTIFCAGVMDLPVYKLVKSLGTRFIVAGDPVWYVGSQCVPVVCEFAECRRVLGAPELPLGLHAQ